MSYLTGIVSWLTDGIKQIVFTPMGIGLSRAILGCTLFSVVIQAMPRTFLLLGSLFAFLAVAAGAFGAHSLKAMLPTEMLSVFETAVRYQLYHALALLIVGWAGHQYPQASLRFAGWLFVCGIILFSGSLYALSLSGVRWLGALTPVGGLAFLAGWAMVGWGCWRSRTVSP